jgi:hypothetical protein
MPTSYRPAKGYETGYHIADSFAQFLNKMDLARESEA